MKKVAEQVLVLTPIPKQRTYMYMRATGQVSHTGRALTLGSLRALCGEV